MRPFTLALGKLPSVKNWQVRSLASIFMLVHCCYTPAHAHDWYTGRKDPKLLTKCCTGIECQEITEESVTKLSDGGYFYRPNGWNIPADRVQISPDSNYHICKTPIVTFPPESGYDLLCFFAPLETM